MPRAGDARNAREAPLLQRVVYACENGTRFRCLVYDSRGRLLRSIVEGIDSPVAAEADPSGRLYVANEYSDTVTVYERAGLTHVATLDTSPYVPVDVAVHGSSVAVAGLREIAVFVDGVRKRTLQIPGVLQASSVAFDSAGNCYVAFVKNTFGSAVDSFDGCRGQAHEHEIDSGTPYAIAFDSHDNLYFTDVGPDTEGLYACKGLAGCVLRDGRFLNALHLNFSSGFRHLVLGAQTSSGRAAVFEVDVKSGAIVRTIVRGFNPSNPPLGVALAPGPQY